MAGERKTLRTVARFADAWNVSLVTPDEAAAKSSILDRWCDEVGRDPAEIERTISLGPIVIRDDPADAKSVIAAFHARNPGMQRPVVALSGQAMIEHVQRYVDVGFRHAIFHLATPYDPETLERFVTEVRPALG